MRERVKKVVTRLSRSVRVWLAGLGLILGLAGNVYADGLPTFTLTFRSDGTFDPVRLEVPSGRFKLVLINDSKEPVEFESLPLRKEKVMGPGVKSFVVITISRPGEYPFFDDFHQDVKGTLVVVPKK